MPDQTCHDEMWPTKQRWLRTAIVCALMMLVAACSTLKKKPEAAPAPPAPVLPVVKPLEATPGLSPRDRMNKVLDLLEEGDWRVGRVELLEYVRERPNSELGKSLLAQLDEDPRKLLGETNFKYTIKHGESLYELAERFLGDQFKFAGLARYNNISVPEKALAGQVILIPGEPKEVTARKLREQQAELDERLAAEAPKPVVEAEKPVVSPPPPPLKPQPTAAQINRANALRKTALQEMQRGFADKAASLLEEAIKLFPNSQLIKRDLERARRLQSLPGASQLR
jgi:hypothetical protein